MNNAGACVSVVDDDALVLRSLRRLLQCAGFQVETFSSPQQFLAHSPASPTGCVVMDLCMPGINGLQLQRALAVAEDSRPVVFISGHGNVATTVEAMKAGAVDFLTKPLDEDRLLGAVRAALEKSKALREEHAARVSLDERLSMLTPREREVMDGVVAGKLNKQIAAELGTAEKTIKVHRARMMRKMQVDSLAELVRAWTAIRHPTTD